MLPTRQKAETLLKEAEICNPGPWGNNSRAAAPCTEKCTGIDTTKDALKMICRHDNGVKKSTPES